MKCVAIEDKYEHLAISRAGRVLTVKLNRPEQLNAIDAVMHRELAEVFTYVAFDEASDVVVLTGAGRAFSAGGDMQWLQQMIDEPRRFDDINIREARRIISSLLDCEKPLIAKVNGHAVGLGATLALFCDVIFASQEAKIGDPHVNIGFAAADGGAVIWPQLIGFARAKEYLMTGELLTAARAAQIGLINHVLPAAELDHAVDAFCARLQAGALQSIRWTKMTINIELKRIANSLIDAGLAFEGLSNRSADHRAAVDAFRAKRQPAFTGQ